MSQKKLKEATASNKDLSHYKKIFSSITNAKNKLYKNDSKIKESTEETMPTLRQFRASLAEKTLTPAEMKKREDVAKAIERENPNMPMGMKMAIATKTAKRVAEAGPFGYGAKNPRKGSIEANADQKRKEQDKGKQPVEPRDQMVGVARKVMQGVAEEQIDELKTGTLLRYHTKAGKSGLEAGVRASKSLDAGKYVSAIPDLNTREKRMKGQMQAMSKIQKRYATEEAELEEAITSKDIKMAVGVVKDKRYAGGNMTGAVSTIEKIRKNLSKHPRVQQALKTANEEVNKLEEGAGAEKRFQEYHNETAKLMKGIHSALSKHYSAHEHTAHWGHVGDIRHIHDQLRDIHDRLHEQGEYNKNPNKISEEVDDEGSMAKGQLNRMIDQATGLVQMMDDDKQLDGWVQSKLTMASDYLDSVHDYLMHSKQDVDDMEEEAIVETKGAPKGFHFTRDGKLRRGDANQDGSGGSMLRSDPLDKQRSKVPAVSEDTDGEHLCAKHVYSNVHGEGVVLEGMHAEPDEDGNIEWYGVEFSDGPRKVFTEKLEVMVAEYHGNHKKKKRTIG
jgi:hypothetical protein